MLTPICTAETAQSEEYLPEWRPIIDAVAGNPRSIIGQLVLLRSHEGVELDVLGHKVRTLQQQGLPPVEYAPRSAHLDKWVLGQGLAEKVGRRYVPTPVGRRAAGVLAVYIDTALEYDGFAMGVICGQTAPKGRPDADLPYANRPTGFLRALQHVYANRGVRLEDIRPHVPGLEESTLRSGLARMVRYGLLSASGGKSTYHRQYSLSHSGYPMMDSLLRKLCSLSDESFHAEALAAAEHMTADPQSVSWFMHSEPRLLPGRTPHPAAPPFRMTTSPKRRNRALQTAAGKAYQDAQHEKLHDRARAAGMPDWLLRTYPMPSSGLERERLRELAHLFDANVLTGSDEVQQLHVHPLMSALFTDIERAAFAFHYGYDKWVYAEPITMSYIEKHLKTPGNKPVASEAALAVYVDTRMLPRLAGQLHEIHSGSGS